MRTIKSFSFAIKGLITAWKEEVNFRIEILAAILVIFLISYFDFSLVESSILIFAITLVLTMEIFNTVIEDLCNKVEPNMDQVIGKIKDLSSSAVLISSLGAIVIGILVFINHFI